jgi:HAD superfamily hydrolase (TIGR01509 family)
MPMAVVSGSLAEIVHMELKVVGIFNLFYTIITGDDPFKPKPDPQCFLESARRLKVHPKNVVVFEDGESGLKAARRAVIYTIDVDDLIF